MQKRAPQKPHKSYLPNQADQPPTGLLSGFTSLRCSRGASSSTGAFRGGEIRSPSAPDSKVSTRTMRTAIESSDEVVASPWTNSKPSTRIACRSWTSAVESSVPEGYRRGPPPSGPLKSSVLSLIKPHGIWQHDKRRQNLPYDQGRAPASPQNFRIRLKPNAREYLCCKQRKKYISNFSRQCR